MSQRVIEVVIKIIFTIAIFQIAYVIWTILYGRTYIDYTIGHDRNSFWAIGVHSFHVDILVASFDTFSSICWISNFHYVPLRLFYFQAISYWICLFQINILVYSRIRIHIDSYDCQSWNPNKNPHLLKIVNSEWI